MKNRVINPRINICASHSAILIILTGVYAVFRPLTRWLSQYRAIENATVYQWVNIMYGLLRDAILAWYVLTVKTIFAGYKLRERRLAAGCRPCALFVKYILINCVLLIPVVTGCASTKGAARYEDGGHGERAYRYFKSGNMPGAAGQYKKAYASARKNDRVADAAHALANVGRVYYEMGRHDSAALYLTNAREDFVTLGDAEAASKTAAFLALCAAEQGGAEQAREWLQAARAHSWKGSEHYHALITAKLDMRLSSKITNEGELDAAQTFYKKKKDYPALTTIYVLKSDAEFHRGGEGGCAEAERFLREALNANDKAREPYRRSGLLLKMSAIKFRQGDAAAGKHYYDRARDCAPKGAAKP